MIIQPSSAGSKTAADFFQSQLQSEARSVLGLATGSTPLGLYRELICRHAAGEINFARVRTFNLDEYVGLSPTHPRSYSAFTWKHLFGSINVSRERVHIPNGPAKDISTHCHEYETLIDKFGPIDLQLLGLGREGHIGFHEPSASLNSRTRLKTLTHFEVSPFVSGNKEETKYFVSWTKKVKKSKK